MFGPPSHALDSFPVVCLIWVFVKISLNFVVKYSAGVTYNYYSWLKSPPTRWRDVDVYFGDKHIYSLTISVKDKNGDLFDFNVFPLEFEVEFHWLYIQCLYRTWCQVRRLNNSIRSFRLTTFGWPESVKFKKKFPAKSKTTEKSPKNTKKAQTATHYVAVGLDNACSILCFALFFQRHPNSKMAKRTSFDNPRGNFSFTGSKNAFFCKNCFMKKRKLYIPLVPEMRKRKIKTFFSIIMKYVKCGTWRWNVLPKMRLDQRECFFQNPPWEKK